MAWDRGACPNPELSKVFAELLAEFPANMAIGRHIRLKGANLSY